MSFKDLVNEIEGEVVEEVKLTIGVEVDDTSYVIETSTFDLRESKDRQTVEDLLRIVKQVNNQTNKAEEVSLSKEDLEMFSDYCPYLEEGEIHTVKEITIEAFKGLRYQLVDTKRNTEGLKE